MGKRFGDAAKMRYLCTRKLFSKPLPRFGAAFMYFCRKKSIKYG